MYLTRIASLGFEINGHALLMKREIRLKLSSYLTKAIVAETDSSKSRDKHEEKFCGCEQ
jgi:hypothetical protein